MQIEQHDIDLLKNSLNIVDVINNYVDLKKKGKNHFACCPFHGEKTPSFSVDEDDQFYHCFGCGAHGDVFKFIMEIENIDFIDAYKKLDGKFDSLPSKYISENQKRASRKSIYKLPESHKENNILCKSAISKCKKVSENGLVKFTHESGFAYPIISSDGKLINLMVYKKGQEKQFLCGGLSYNGFTPIKLNNTNNYVLCVSMANGVKIAHEYNVNVAVCWSDLVMKYIHLWNHGKLKTKPAIDDSDDDYLCYETDWIKILPGDVNRSIKIKNMEQLI